MIGDKLIKYYAIAHTLINPYNSEQLNPNSYDVTLDYCTDREGMPIKRNYIKPGEFLLASTKETVNIPVELVGIMKGKSTLARKGLRICGDAGLIDSGFKGQITLELFNMSQSKIYIQEGMKIAQICFHTVEGGVENPYNGHYQHQKGVKKAAY